ncbi:hypothetical protein DFH09DRAFT_1419898, partial [Mycena vulgaris]
VPSATKTTRKKNCQPLLNTIYLTKNCQPPQSRLVSYPHNLILSLTSTMHTSTLALLLLGATAAYAHPLALDSPRFLARDSPRSLAVRSEHMLPAMPMPMPDAVTNTAGRDPHADEPSHADEPTHKRQIHNADYHANAPPPSPNPTPAPAQDPSPASPANPPAPAPPQVAQKTEPTKAEPALKAKRVVHLAPGPVRVEPPSSAECGESSKEAEVEHDSGRHVNKRSNVLGAHRLAPGPVRLEPPSNAECGESSKETEVEHDSGRHVNKRSSVLGAHRPAALSVTPKIDASMPKLDSKWPGWRRRTAEELTNAHNPALDHGALMRWSRDEVDRMQAWSRAHMDSA